MDNYISKEKLEELEKKLKELETTKRFEIAERLKKAKEHGDLSENFDYTQAKEDQERLEREISRISQMIKDVKVIKKSKDTNVVFVGHTVILQNKNGDELEVTIVGSQDTDPISGKISNTSPIGKAVIGHKIGDTIIANTPKGKVKFKISKIK